VTDRTLNLSVLTVVLVLVLGVATGCQGPINDVPTDPATEAGSGNPEGSEDPEDPEGLIEELVHAINSFREEHSLSTLVWDEGIADGALDHTEHMEEIRELTYSSQHTDGVNFLSDFPTVHGISLGRAAGDVAFWISDGFELFETLNDEHLATFFSDPDMTYHAVAKVLGQAPHVFGDYQGYYVTYVLAEKADTLD